MAGLGRRTHYRKHLTDSVLYDLPEPKEDERIAKVVATRGGNQFDIILAVSGGNENDDDVGTGRNNNNSTNEPGLAILPTKFHKLVWVKRNDYVIVQTGIDAAKPGGGDDDGGDGNRDGDDETGEGRKKNNEKEATAETGSSGDPGKTGIRFIINHILYKDQVKHLVSRGLWPTHDPEFPVAGTATTGPGERGDGDDDGGVGDSIIGGSGTATEQTDHHHRDDGIVYTEYDMDNDDDLFVNTNRIARLEIQDSDSEDSSDDED